LGRKKPTGLGRGKEKLAVKGKERGKPPSSIFTEKGREGVPRPPSTSGEKKRGKYCAGQRKLSLPGAPEQPVTGRKKK